jgi:hypothetical protein
MSGETPARSRIFISYRREDSAGHVLALIPQLRQRFGTRRIFKDTDNIAPGQDFLNVIQRELETCAVLVAVIGRDWLTVQDPRLKCRRLDAANDFLRLEVATALKDEHILVIPALVGRATMPAADDLPPDLQALARRHAVELSDLRWDADIEHLMQAIERACAQPTAPRQSNLDSNSIRPDSEPKTHGGVPAWQREMLESRRKRQIAQHLADARRALEAGNAESALQSCEKIAWLDPDEPASQALAESARNVLEQRKIDGLVDEARQKLDRGDLGSASELIDEALLLNATYEPAVTLRQRLLRERRSRDRERERSRLVQAAVDRARACLKAGDMDGAVQSADDALALDADCAEAVAIRSSAVSTSPEGQQAGQQLERAKAAIGNAREMFASGKHEAALKQLAEFAPPHDLVVSALQELRRQFEELHRQQHERRARQTIDGARKVFAAGNHDAAVAALEAFDQPHELVTQSLREMRIEIAAIQRARQEHEQREQKRRERELEAERRMAPQRGQRAESNRLAVIEPTPPAASTQSESLKPDTNVPSAAPSDVERRFFVQPWMAAAVVIGMLGFGIVLVVMRSGRQPGPAQDVNPTATTATAAAPDSGTTATTTNEAESAGTKGESTDPVTPTPEAPPPPAAVASPADVATAGSSDSEAAPLPATVPAGGEPTSSNGLGNLRARALKQQKAGQRELALGTTAQGLALEPSDPTLLNIQASLLRDAQANAAQMKRAAIKLDAENWAPEPFHQGLDRETNAVKLRQMRNLDAATHAFWGATDRFGAAVTESRRAQKEANREQTAPVKRADEKATTQPNSIAEPRSNSVEQRPNTEQRPTGPGKPAVVSILGDRADQQSVTQTLRRYEAAYGTDIDTVRRLYPAAPGSLAAEFGTYQSYKLRIEIEEFRFFGVPPVEWVAVHCHVTEDIQPKSGRRVQKDGPRIFRLQRQGAGWIIISID